MSYLCLPSESCLYDIIVFEHFLTFGTARYSGSPCKCPALTLDSAISQGALVPFSGEWYLETKMGF